ncbi:hypothetical protein [Brevibacillus aydinogluensis]|uniref:Uncharacterized protein n=1 Tax=Brevibacillus aydinogluensis TaxID=927786 RepID=A0AA48M8K8_9BACL|nr:hypothetical protein [Brevibacillus aydinogluensis]CAJ1001013.1 hypothetical protein BSPP4475_01565 [Brevibacillus aydinogluensis]
MRQFIDPETGEVFYEEQILRRPDEIVKVFRPAGRNAKFVKIKASQKAKRRLRKLSLAEAGFLLKIAPYASEGTNLLLGDNERGQKTRDAYDQGTGPDCYNLQGKCRNLKNHVELMK